MLFWLNIYKTQWQTHRVTNVVYEKYKWKKGDTMFQTDSNDKVARWKKMYLLLTLFGPSRTEDVAVCRIKFSSLISCQEFFVIKLTLTTLMERWSVSF